MNAAHTKFYGEPTSWKIYLIPGFFTGVVKWLLVKILLDFEGAFDHHIKDNEPYDLRYRYTILVGNLAISVFC